MGEALLEGGLAYSAKGATVIVCPVVVEFVLRTLYAPEKNPDRRI